MDSLPWLTGTRLKTFEDRLKGCLESRVGDRVVLGCEESVD